MQKSLQQKWYFVQHFTQGIGGYLQPLLDYLYRDFLLDVLFGAKQHMSGWYVTQIPAKHAGLELPDPTLSTPDNWTASLIISIHLVEAFQGLMESQYGDTVIILKDNRADIWCRNYLDAK